MRNVNRGVYSYIGRAANRVAYYLGHETVVPRQDRRALPRRLEAMFAFMQRNSAHATDYFRLPADPVVEIGRQVAI